MKNFLTTIAILSISLVAFGQKKLSFRAYQGFEYVMRFAPGAGNLIRSQNTHLDPWLPAGQFGWQFTDQETFDRFMEPPNGYQWRIDFDKFLVLTLIRQDPYEWNMQVSKVRYNPKTAEVKITYTGRSKSKILDHDALSVLVLLIEKSPVMQQIGDANINFSVDEVVSRFRPDHNFISGTEHDLLFPVAYTLQDLTPYFASLKEDQTASESNPPIRPEVKKDEKPVPEVKEISGYEYINNLPAGPSKYLVMDNLTEWEAYFSLAKDNHAPAVSEKTFADYYAVALIKNPAFGNKVAFREISWSKAGLQFHYDIHKEAQITSGPGFNILLVERGKHGVISFREY